MSYRYDGCPAFLYFQGTVTLDFYNAMNAGAGNSGATWYLGLWTITP